MTTVYKNNIPYADNNGAVLRWASDNTVGTVTSAIISKVRAGHWNLTANGSVIRSFAGAPSAMTALYELVKAGGGNDTTFSALAVTLSPVTDMTDITVTGDDVTIAGHTWEDYSGTPEVIFYGANNRVITRVSVTGTEVVPVPADAARIVVGSSGAVPVFYTAVTIPTYEFTADRRPMFISGYASQKMTQINNDGGTIALEANGQTWGVNKNQWRKAPVAGSDPSLFLSTATNGPLNYADNLFVGTDKPIEKGFERFTFSFISGWTCLVGEDDQPHYPSNPFSGMEQTQTKVMTNPTTDIGSFTSLTPFTDTGDQNGTPGDLKECWKVTVADMKTRITAEGGNPEIIAYAGYRPLYTDNTMAAIDRTLMGYSKQADRGGWTGTGDSPAYSPTPGQTTNTSVHPQGYSASDEAFDNWWGYECNGIRDLGFDGIGLDTGAAMWWNTAGMTGAAGNEGSSPGSPRLYNLFYSYGIAAQIEAVNWDGRGDTTKPWGGADGTLDSNAGEIYEQGPAWGLAGTTVGWVGRTQDSHELLSWNGSSVSPSDGTLYANVYNRDGLSGVDTAAFTTVGDPLLGGSQIPLIGPTGKGTEVHSSWRFNNSVVNALFNAFSWTAVQQIIFDFHNAGFVISMGGSVTATVNDKDGVPVTSAMFMQYIMDLANGVITQRPGANPPVDPNQLPLGINARLMREHNAPTDIVATSSGWLRANNSYTSIQSATATVPTQDGNYPRIRVSGTGSSRKCLVDVAFGSTAARDNFIAENDATQMRLRLTVTDAAGAVIGIRESDPVDTDGNPWPPSATNDRLTTELDVSSFIVGTAPTGGDSTINWDGLPEGYVLNGGYTIEFYTP